MGAAPETVSAALPAEEVRPAEAKAPPAAVVNTCTTLCLWEPDADMMIKRAQGWERARKSEDAATARRGVREEQAEESGTAEIKEFEMIFAEELRACRDTSQIVADQAQSDASTQGHFDWWHEQLRELHSLVVGASNFLPTNLREKFVKQLAELEAKLKEQRERLAPKKKFGFKNRSKVGGKAAAAKSGGAANGAADGAGAADGEGATIATNVTAAAEGAASGDGTASVAGASSAASAAAAAAALASAAADPLRRQVGKDTFVAVHNSECPSFRDVHGQSLTRPAGLGPSSDFALDNLDHCEVRLLSPSTGLWIRGLKHCLVICVPLNGFVYVSECTDCTFVFGARQLRIHTSTDCDLYIHAASHPILEHCSAMRFAPYPRVPKAFERCFETVGLAADKNQWKLVDDFDWLKASHSPNWSVLPDAERRVDFARMATFAGEEPGGVEPEPGAPEPGAPAPELA